MTRATVKRKDGSIDAYHMLPYTPSEEEAFYRATASVDARHLTLRSGAVSVAPTTIWRKRRELNSNKKQ